MNLWMPTGLPDLSRTITRPTMAWWPIPQNSLQMMRKSPETTPKLTPLPHHVGAATAGLHAAGPEQRGREGAVRTVVVGERQIERAVYRHRHEARQGFGEAAGEAALGLA